MGSADRLKISESYPIDVLKRNFLAALVIHNSIHRGYEGNLLRMMILGENVALETVDGLEIAGRESKVGFVISEGEGGALGVVLINTRKYAPDDFAKFVESKGFDNFVSSSAEKLRELGMQGRQLVPMSQALIEAALRNGAWRKAI